MYLFDMITFSLTIFDMVTYDLWFESKKKYIDYGTIRISFHQSRGWGYIVIETTF